MKIYNPNFARFLAQTRLDSLSTQPADTTDNPKLIKLKKACQDFEAIFISYMLKTMNKTTGDSGLFGEGLGNDIYRDIFNEKLAEHLSHTGQFKIGDMLYNEFAERVKAEPIKPEPSLPVSINRVNLRNSTPAENMPGASIPQADHTMVAIPATKNPEVSARGSSKAKDPLLAYDDAISKAAKEFDVKPELIKAVIRRESAGDPRAVSAKGAKGLMQLLDSTAEMLGVKDSFDPVENIRGGVKYLSMLISRFEGDLKKALASYNAGPAAVEKHDGVPPYPETIKYVKDVMSGLSSE